MNEKKLIFIIFTAIIILAGFGFAAKVSAAVYQTTGTLISENLLEGKTVTTIESFYYNASDIPTGTSLKVLFSENSSTWYGSSGVENDWDDCTVTGGETISLSTLGWTSANFYYKMEFSSNPAQDATPVLDEVKVNYTGSTATFGCKKKDGCSCTCSDGACIQCFGGYCCTGTCQSTACEAAVSTNDATNVATSTAQLNGELTNMAGASLCYTWFQWGETTDYGNVTASSTLTETGTFNETISDLTEGGTYHFRAVANNTGGTSYGGDKSFTLSTGCTDHNVAGWAWSENIGWVSYSCKNCDQDNNGYVDSAGNCGGDNASTLCHDYGVDLDENSGVLSGEAWSSNVGWISFNYSRTGAPPASPDYSAGGYIAMMSTSTYEASGWMRALCASSTNSGDWDGWIKLKNP